MKINESDEAINIVAIHGLIILIISINCFHSSPKIKVTQLLGMNVNIIQPMVVTANNLQAKMYE